MTEGLSSCLRLTTMREVAHIMSSGLTFNISQHWVVISGTGAFSSISGNSMSCFLSCASMLMLWVLKRVAKPLRRFCSSSPHLVRPAMSIWKLLSESHLRPLSIGSHDRAPRSSSCMTGLK